ncbi:unnamed protein product [Aspergillus oryzae]|uniref:Unnamed protein product n=1 Tax=Aspergillus oryzae TaxID=5062 RepID=A0AAN5BV96_ASPOZ|nr:unnamed protein product [Aspergillus oryzae]
MMRTVVSSGNDALNILFEAAAAHSKEHGNGLSESNHNNHRWLVSHDPVLCCTILMISSRYHLLPGAGGGSRNFFIHHRLWQHCQQLVMRLMFGQEKSSQSKVRNIGTIEALMLMSEWHPRSLHFPPESDGWDFDLTSVPPEPQELEDSSSTNRWLEDMIEPARRSDQMSWMLLGSALSLAHELGIFELDEKKLGYASGYEGFISGEQIKLRRQRVQRLLYVYINQLAWRIGCVSLMPQSLNHAILGRRATKELNQTGDEWLIFMDSWMDLTKLAKSVTDMFFPTVSFARQQLHSGRYIELLDHFRPILDKWKEEHLQVRFYTHSVGMQAVVERVLADSDPRAEEVRALNIDPIDYEYIQEVIDGCCQILQKVIQLAENGVLRFCPVRIFLRITSSSIFLMKALSLGTRQSTLRESLDVLERSIQALRSNALDDIHLSTRYAALLDMHVARLRRNLLASSKTVKSNQGTASRPSMGVSSSTDHGSNTPMMDISMSQNISDMGYIPSLNDIAADDWLSLPFDPSMAPFGISSAGQFPAYEGGALNFIWNLPS